MELSPPSTPANAGSSTSALGLDKALLLQGAQHHDRTRDRQGQPEHQPSARRPAHRMSQREAEPRHDRDLPERARDRDGPHGHQVGEREMQPHPEHEQDDAEFGKLRGESLVGDVARRERPDHDPGHEIADERREAQPLRNRAAQEGETDAGHDGGDQRGIVRHGFSFGRWRSVA
jgi:hypothetical protein